ncbi:hypothetical protein K461DRAFT_137450 [Myriangium duriaei CBS 260.36]|uniref:DASH complex subunit DUO1 n=1 Tax=Myriangium duriaei CBS 260.36 TaxID=1168546 RepID=A0A9P4J353_9PEZI|nr:hypothetical protein K461DRAFT_137450 [Myriangium duriaei CBS 260.36]
MSRNFASLKLDDSDTEETATAGHRNASDPQADGRTPTSQQTPSRIAGQRRGEDTERDNVLRKELEKIRGVNQVVERVIESLERSRGNMNTVHTSVRSASTLLDTWTRILSQTEHNQRLLLNPEWRGATQDMEDMENESMLRQQAAERRAAEEETRREAAARAAEEEDRKRAAVSSSSRGTRARGRGLSSTTRGTSTRGATLASASTRRTTSTTRAGSGIGRGISGSRGRGRGA